MIRGKKNMPYHFSPGEVAGVQSAECEGKEADHEGANREILRLRRKKLPWAKRLRAMGQNSKPNPRQETSVVK